MRKCAIMVGIDRTPHLPYLFAAASGAEAMHEWAEGQGYESKLITDREGPVTVNMIQDALTTFVNDHCYDLLLIYFAGHGIQRAPGSEIWLLSEAMTKGGEAVDVNLSKNHSSVCGIPHVVFISDACRQQPTARQMSILGGNIFPTYPTYEDTDVSIDALYATRPGAIAWEARRASGKNTGLYTQELLRGLKFKVPSVVRNISLPQGEISVVMSRELNRHLATAVPRNMLEAGLSVSQTPSGQITSDPPLHLSQATDGLLSALPAQDSQPEQRNRDGRLREKLEEVLESRPNSDSLRREVNEDILELQARGLEETGEIQTGFRIIGAEVVGVMPNFVGYEVYRESGASVISFREYGDFQYSIIVQIANGHAVPLQLLPRFVGQVIFVNNRLMNITYVPSRSNPRNFQYLDLKERIEERKALIAVASRFGVFEDGSVAGDYLRRFKALDPMLGLFASYAYYNSGNFNGIRSVYRYMDREQEPVLSDVQYLNLASRGYPYGKTAFPLILFPVLTQGWALMPFTGFGFLQKLSGMLVPGLWTTFNEKGFRYIAKRKYF